jgi:hypothetical protein
MYIWYAYCVATWYVVPRKNLATLLPMNICTMTNYRLISATDCRTFFAAGSVFRRQVRWDSISATKTMNKIENEQDKKQRNKKTRIKLKPSQSNRVATSH